MNRARRYRLFLALVCALLANAGAAEDRPNIVLIVADYMGAGDIGPYGATDISTPALDALAAEGIKFTNYYAAAPICGPSRAAMLTGRYPSRLGFERNIRPDFEFSANVPTVPGVLGELGYTSAAIGKWHLGTTEQTDPLGRGFDEFFGFHSWTAHYYTHRSSNGEEALVRNRNVIEEDGYLTDLLTDEAIRFIEKNRDEPFYAYVAYNAALPPYLGPGIGPEGWDVGFDVGDATRETYVSMVEALDRGIGRILDSIGRLNLEANTLVLFTFDHNGRHLVDNSPYRGGFGTLNEGGLKVPLIIRGPGVSESGTVRDDNAIGMDIAATIIAAAGGDAANAADGRNLLEGVSQSRVLFWRIDYQGYEQTAMRSGRWKLIADKYQYYESPTISLYDVDTDPGETQDLYLREQSRAESLYQQMVEWNDMVDTGRTQ